MSAGDDFKEDPVVVDFQKASIVTEIIPALLNDLQVHSRWRRIWFLLAHALNTAMRHISVIGLLFTFASGLSGSPPIMGYIGGALGTASLGLIPLVSWCTSQSSKHTLQFNQRRTQFQLNAKYDLPVLDPVLIPPAATSYAPSSSSSLQPLELGAIGRPIAAASREMKDPFQIAREEACIKYTIPALKLDLEFSIKWRSRLQTLSPCLLLTARILQLCGSLLALIANGLHNGPHYLYFIAGACQAVASALGPESTNCDLQCEVQTRNINACEAAMGIHGPPYEFPADELPPPVTGRISP